VIDLEGPTGQDNQGLENGQIEDTALEVHNMFLILFVVGLLGFHASFEMSNFLVYLVRCLLEVSHVLTEHIGLVRADKGTLFCIEFFFEFERNVHIVFVTIIIGVVLDTERVIVIRVRRRQVELVLFLVDVFLEEHLVAGIYNGEFDVFKTFILLLILDDGLLTERD